MKERILITGALGGNIGWLAGKFYNYFSKLKNLYEPILSEVDITDPEAVKKELDRVRPDILLNAAGITGGTDVENGVSGTIDWCEDEPLITFNVNTMGVLILGFECLKRDIKMVHLGSGCIYDGDAPDSEGFKESDQPQLPSLYTVSKYAADLILEYWIRKGLLKALVVRLRMPIDSEPHPRNLLTKAISYPEVIDVQNSVTPVEDFLVETDSLIRKDVVGIFHAVSPGTISLADLREIYRCFDPSVEKAKVISVKDLKTKASRSNCVLSTEKRQKLGILSKRIRPRVQYDIIPKYLENLKKQ